MFHTLGWVNPNVELDRFLEYPALVQQVYRAHHHQLIWLQIEDQLLIEDMLEMLSLAELSPQFEQRLDALSQLRIQHNYFQYDLIATDTLLMIMSYRARLLENQETWLFGEGIPDLWSNPPQMELDALELAIDNNRLSQFLMQFGGSEPNYRAYQTAINYLQQRQDEASVDYESDTLIRVGEELPNRELLHIKLELAGLDLSTVDTQKEWYSRDLEKLVKQFQEQHGLQPDGIIGPNTIEWLNYPIEERIRRLALNAERSHLWPTQREAWCW
ncbi:L,D-transpeptidase YcbB [Vibrio ishigakensis]|uniref:L,D-transpeptidase YcbB n=1 Tax=Vibrio ishigakensis TaxID=1481914 RepID=A0A0B8PJ77_9VIBR|nr:L,D-transpeptidase YcbB [Vibrio ishigakensis]